MIWKIIHTAQETAQSIMAKDAYLLETLEDTPIIHFYEWKNEAATFGCFTNPAEYLNMQAVKELNLDLAKRPTGGGIVFHICDLAFSVLIPASFKKFSINTLENYALINEAVVQTIQEIQNDKPLLLPEEALPMDLSCKAFCMAKPTKYDVMIQGRKIGGASQRRTKKGFLHQGTICIATLPIAYLEKVLLPGTQVIAAMQQNSYSLLGSNWNKKELNDLRIQIQNVLQHYLTII